MDDDFKRMMRQSWLNALKIIIPFLLACAIIGMLTSCRSQQVDISEDMFIHDTLRIVNLQHDSIFHLDSIFLREFVKGDTVYQQKTQYKYIYRDRAKTDTCYIHKTDTVTKREVYTEEVEHPLSWWQKLRIFLGNIVLLSCLLTVVYYSYKFRNKIMR